MVLAVSANKRLVQQETRGLIIPDLSELLSLPGSEPSPALSDFPEAVDCKLRQMIEIRHFGAPTTTCACPEQNVLSEGNICGNCLQIDLDRFRDYRINETLRALKAAQDLNMPKQVIMHTRAYVNQIPTGLMMAIEGTFESLVFQHLDFLMRVWGREMDASGFFEHSWMSNIPTAIPRAALEFVRDRINPRRHLMPFYTGLSVMTKGIDPYALIHCTYGVVTVKLEFSQWE